MLYIIYLYIMYTLGFIYMCFIYYWELDFLFTVKLKLDSIDKKFRILHQCKFEKEWKYKLESFYVSSYKFPLRGSIIFWKESRQINMMLF